MIQRVYLILVVFLCVLTSVGAFLTQNARIVGHFGWMKALECSGSSSAANAAPGSVGRYKNPAYDDSQLEEWWKSVSRSLLTVGGKGVQPSHMNSLASLLVDHGHVRVKVASDQLDAFAIATEFCENEAVARVGELLECRSKEFMFGRVGPGQASPLRTMLEKRVRLFIELSDDVRPELTGEAFAECLAMGSETEVRQELEAIQQAFKKKGKNFLFDV